MSAADVVFIRGLAVETRIGVYAWEREVRQTLVIDLEMRTDIRAAAAGDRIEDALDYHAVAERVRTLVRENESQLLETLAERIAAVVLGEFQVASLRLRLAKPGAVPGAEDVGVLIERAQ